jgi:coproporphyrinogen III oxidase
VVRPAFSVAAQVSQPGSAVDLAGLVRDVLLNEQERLVREFEEIDGKAFASSLWEREALGRGRARTVDDGRVFERAGVNVSAVHGKRVPEAISAAQPHLAGRAFVATGISMVLHPRNPYAPSFHANFRYFEVDGVGRNWWFGGGMDLTPMYGFAEDAQHFHGELKAWCDRHDGSLYPIWKRACDEYFYIPHRLEMRGLGGVFFDHLTERDRGWDQCLALVVDGIRTIIPAYLPIVQRRMGAPYDKRERDWQLLRRGRYAEFNLVYDRGTLFGLQTGGNIEAILMSMPPVAGWAFDVTPEPGSPEAEALGFLQPREWVRDGN